MLWTPGVFRSELHEDDDGGKDIHRLCDVCRSLTFTFVFDKVPTLQELIACSEDDHETPRVPHHIDINALITSARDGCHSCTLIVAELCKAEMYAGSKTSTFSHAEALARVRVTFNGQVFVSAYESRKMLMVYDSERSRTSLEIADGKWLGPEDRADANMSAYNGREGIRAKLDLCRKSHQNCGIQEQASAAKRLIDISGGLESLRLIDSSSSSILRGQAARQVHAEYATVSHRWLPNLECKTTISNLTDHHVLIPKMNLPAHFRDAILLAQFLGLSRIWIDSLCIIQEGDGGADWSSEAPKMAAIYRGAAVNISIDVADASNGFLPINLREISPCKLPAFPGQFIKPWTPANQQALDLGGLEKRGWILQERLLPRRIVHCTPWGLTWECFEVHDGFDAQAFDRKRIRLDQSRDSDAILSASSSFGRSDLLQAWVQVVIKYTRRNLTVSTDRLVAVCGIVQQLLAIDSRMTYIAGIWLEGMILQLGWFTEREDTDTTNISPDKYGWRLKGLAKYCAPSFSWASVDCEVSFIPEKILHGSIFFEPNVKNRCEARMLSYKVESLNNEPFGFVSSAAITLKGLSTTPLQFSKSVWAQAGSGALSDIHRLGTSGLLIMDDESLAWQQDLDDLPQDTLLFMLCNFPLVAALVLVPDVKDYHNFQRIGLWQLFYEEGPGWEIDYTLWSDTVLTIT